MAAAKSEIIKGPLRSQHGNGIRSIIGLLGVRLMKDKKGAKQDWAGTLCRLKCGVFALEQRLPLEGSRIGQKWPVPGPLLC